MLKKVVKIIIFILPLNLFPLSINNYREDGNRSYISQNYLRAIESYKEGLLINPNDIGCNYGLSNSFYMIGEFQEALDYIEKSIILSKDNVEYLNNKARILMAMGEYDESESLYNQVLAEEPYNINSQSGLAELRIVTGDVEGSLKEFESITQFSPESRRLLLSLVVLYDKTSNFSKSDSAIQKAIKIFPKDPIVLKAAVNHYIITENYFGASLYINELIKISEDPENLLLQGRLHFLKKEYREAIDVLSFYIKENKRNHYAYYLIALSLDFSGDKEKALNILSRGLKLAPENEIYRFYIEKLAREVYLYKDNRRNIYSKWYLENGNLLENDFYYKKAMAYYLRGIDIDPLNWELRVKYALVLKKIGNRYGYLKELDFLVNDFPGDYDVSDLNETLQIENSMPKDQIHIDWVNVPLKNKYKHNILIATTKKNNRLNSNSSMIFSDALERFFTGSRRFYVSGNEVMSKGFSSVFKKARDLESNYFVIVDYKEGYRSFSLDAAIYLTSSGRVIKEFSFIKTGNNRIFNALDSFLRNLENFLPLIGTVTEINNNQILADLGAVDGLVEGALVKVVKSGQFEYLSYGDLVEFNPQYYLGDVNIGAISETAFSGVFTSNSSFNLLNKGDNVLIYDVAEEEKTEEISEKNIIDKELIDQLLRVN